jgi:hypothetical protein
MAADPTIACCRRGDGVLSGRPFRVISRRRPRSSAATGAPQQADTNFQKNSASIAPRRHDHLNKFLAVTR